MRIESSKALFARANAVIPGGVNSPVRACRSVGCEPLFISHGDGSRITCADGNGFIDMVGSWGPLILGHAHAEVLDAISDAMSSGTSFGAPTELEVRFAEAITAALPSMEMVRAVSSGTEATMSALRLARGFTGRDKIIKVDGGYHGHADFLLVAAGSGAATLGIPGSGGVTEGIARDTLLVPFNDLDAVRATIEASPEQVAAMIVEPVAGNMGVVPPEPGYLAGLRKICSEHGVVLIFDEVMTGFRVAWGGAQNRYDVVPDMTCLAKVIGGGLPAAAFGGKREIMEKLAPLGPVYQAGTLSGNPLAMAAGLATLEILGRPGTYERLEELSKALADGLVGAASAAQIPVTLNRVGSMMTMFFPDGSESSPIRPIRNYEDAKASNTERYGAFYKLMRERGVYLAPSGFEAAFVSLAHNETDIAEVVAAAAESMRLLD